MSSASNVLITGSWQTIGTGKNTDLGALQRVAEEASACTRCRLAAGRTNVVFGMGNPRSQLILVGEGPGEQEDLQGLPFVGRSGQLLDRLMLEEIGITREDCYVANVVKCLRYTTPVKLGNGSWERIGRLVRQRYQGDVMSVDESGRLVKRPVIGWYATPLAGRRTFRLSYRNAERSSQGTRVNTVLTEDHEVLTPAGWAPVGQLVPGTDVATGEGLSDVARDVVIGTLLGDGHLNASSPHLSISHSVRQRDYALFKAGLLRELHPALTSGVPVRAGDSGPYPVVTLRTAATRSLRVLATDFYIEGPKRRKVVPHWVCGTLNARSLAIWFMDDGHVANRPPRKASAEIATWAFDETSLSVLTKSLDQLGIKCKPGRARLHFDARETEALARAIAPYVPPPMRYKLPPEIAATLPYDRELWRAGPSEVLYDEAIVEEVTHRGTDKTFFCIDVAETHNFVTAGGVVHNCRPPGNRDPLPDEIETCRPYLEAQLDLIDPKVVITLGNFATKALLGTTEGISRLRGRVYPFRSGRLVPTFHPSAALRGGGMVVAQMRADFVRAKEVLRAGKRWRTPALPDQRHDG